MKNPYISYEVIWDNISYKDGDIFTYKKIDKNNTIIKEEIPLFENGKISSKVWEIVENIRQNKKLVEEANKKISNNNSLANEENKPNKNITLAKLQIKAKLSNIPTNMSEKEINTILKDISDEYGISLKEIEKIHEELIAKEIDDNNYINYAEKQSKLNKPEMDIRLTEEEFNIIDKFVDIDTPELDKKDLHKSIKTIEEKYKISYIQLRTIYKIEKYLQNGKNRVQDEAKERQMAVTEIESKKDYAKKIIAEFPDDISNDEITLKMEALANNLSIPEEELFELYKSVKGLKQVESTEPKQDLFQEKVNKITEEDMKTIIDYLTIRPITSELCNKIEEIKSKYNLTGRDVFLAYMGKKKELDKLPKRSVIKGSKFKIERTAKKLEYLIHELKLKDLTKEELQVELDKLSNTYNISQLQMDLLANNAIYKKRKEVLSNKLTKKLTGQKIPSKIKGAKNELASEKLNTINDKNKLIESGVDLVVASKKDDWEKMVEVDKYDRVPIYTAIKIMKILNNGGGISQACKELEKSHNFNINKKKIIEIVSEYSPYGQEFAKKTRKYIMSKPERLAKFMLDKKASFKMKKSKVEEFDSEIAIKQLEDLKKYIIKPSELGLDNVIEPPSPWKAM